MSRAAATLAICLAAAAARGEISAAEIVAKNAAARGGKEAFRKVETMVWLGHIESAHAPAPLLPFKLEQKRGNKTRLEIDLRGTRSLRVFDGERGWKVRPSRGAPNVQPYTLEEVRFAQGAHVIDGPLLGAAAAGASISLAGVDEIGGRRAYRLALQPARGSSEDAWVDAETFLELRYDRQVERPGSGLRRVSTQYGDYREVEGLRVPFLIETGGGPDAPPDHMQIDTVILNAPLDDAIFENPARARPGRSRPGGAPRAEDPGAAAR